MINLDPTPVSCPLVDVKDKGAHEDIAQLLAKLKELPLPTLTTDEIKRIADFLQNPVARPILKIPTKEKDLLIDLGFDLTLKELYKHIQTQAKKYGWDSGRVSIVGSKVAALLGASYFKRAFTLARIDPLTIASEEKWLQFEKRLQDDSDTDFQVYEKGAIREQVYHTMVQICELVAKKFNKCLGTSELVKKAHKEIQQIKMRKDLLISSHYLDVITAQTIKELGLSNFRVSQYGKEKSYEVAVLSIGMEKKVDITFLKGTPDPKIDKTYWSDYDSARITLINDSTFAIESFSSEPGAYLISNVQETYTPSIPLDSKDLLRILTKSMKGLFCLSIDCEYNAFERFIYGMEAKNLFYKFINKKFEDNYYEAIAYVLNLYFTTVRLGKPLLHISHIINPLLFKWKSRVSDPLYKQILNMYTEVSPQEFFSFFQWLSIIQNASQIESPRPCFKLMLPGKLYCFIPLQLDALFRNIPISELAIYLRSSVHITKKISCSKDVELLIHKRAQTLSTGKDPITREVGLRLLLLVREKNTAPLLAELACINATPLLTVFPELTHKDPQDSIKKLAVEKDIEKQELAVELLKRYPNPDTSLFLFSTFVAEKQPLALRVLPATYSNSWLYGIGKILEDPEKFLLDDLQPLWEKLDAHQAVNLSIIALNNLINRHNRVKATFLSLNILEKVVAKEHRKVIQKSIVEHAPEEHKNFVSQEIESSEGELRHLPVPTPTTKIREVAVKDREEPSIRRLKYVLEHHYWRDACHVLGSISLDKRSAEVLAPGILTAIKTLQHTYHPDGCKFAVEIYKSERYKTTIQSLFITWVSKNEIKSFPGLAEVLHILKHCIARSLEVQEFFITTLTTDRNRSLVREFASPVLACLYKNPDRYIDLYQHFVLIDPASEAPCLLEVFQTLFEANPYDIRLHGLWSGVAPTITEGALHSWVSAAIDAGNFRNTYPIFIKYLSRTVEQNSKLILSFLENFSTRLNELKEQELADLVRRLNPDNRKIVANIIVKLTLQNALDIVNKLPQSFVNEQKLVSAIITTPEFLSYAQTALYDQLMPYQNLFLGDYNLDEDIKEKVSIQFLGSKDVQVQRLGARIALFSKTSEETLLQQSLKIIEKTGIEDILIYATHSRLFQTINKESAPLQISVANIYGKALSQENSKKSRFIEKHYFELLEVIDKESRSSINLQKTLEAYPTPALYRKAIAWILESEKKDIGLDINYILTHIPEMEHADSPMIRQLSTLLKDERVKEKEKAAICILGAFSDVPMSHVTPISIIYLLNHILNWDIQVAICWIKKIIGAVDDERLLLHFFNKILLSKAPEELSILQLICSKVLAMDIDGLLSPDVIKFLIALEKVIDRNKKNLEKGRDTELTSIKHFKKFKAVFDYVFSQEPLTVCLGKWEKISPTKDPTEIFLQFQHEVLTYLRKETFDSHKRTVHSTKVIRELFERTTKFDGDRDPLYEAVEELTVTTLFIGPEAEEYAYQTICKLMQERFFIKDKEKFEKNRKLKDRDIPLTKQEKKSHERVLFLLMYVGDLTAVAEFAGCTREECAGKYIKALEKIFADPKKKIGLNKLALANLIDRFSELSEIVPKLDPKKYSEVRIAYYGLAKSITSRVMEYIKGCGFPGIEEGKLIPNERGGDRISCYARQYISPCIHRLQKAVSDLGKEIPLPGRIQICKALYIATQSIAFIETKNPLIFDLFKLRTAMMRSIFSSPDWLELLRALQLLKCTEKEGHTPSKGEAILEFSHLYLDSFSSMIEGMPEIAILLVKDWIDSISLAKEGMSNWKEIKHKAIEMAINLFSKKTSLINKQKLITKLASYLSE